jgi:hypothetical protein
MMRVRIAMLVTAAGLAGCHDGTQPGKPAADDRPPCAALCEHLDRCHALEHLPGVAECTRICETDPAQTSDPCRTPRIAYERCMAALPCDQVKASAELEAAKAGPCGKEVAAVLACEPSLPVAPFIYFQF